MFPYTGNQPFLSPMDTDRLHFFPWDMQLRTEIDKRRNSGDHADFQVLLLFFYMAKEILCSTEKTNISRKYNRNIFVLWMFFDIFQYFLCTVGAENLLSFLSDCLCHPLRTDQKICLPACTAGFPSHRLSRSHPDSHKRYPSPSAFLRLISHFLCSSVCFLLKLFFQHFFALLQRKPFFLLWSSYDHKRNPKLFCCLLLLSKSTCCSRLFCHDISRMTLCKHCFIQCF